jgi:hypothetical protein
LETSRKKVIEDAANATELSKMICSKHEIPAHIKFLGTKRDFYPRVEVCCDEFSKRIHSELAELYPKIKQTGAVIRK